MNLLELVAKITLDKSEYDKGLSDMQADVKKKETSIKKGMLVAAEAGIAALGAFAVSSVKTGAEFDKSMSQVAATMGLSMAEMQKEVGETETAFGHFEGTLDQFARFMGANTAFTASQAAEALNYMALAGYDAQQSMTMLPNVLSLAAAGNMDLARASDMVTDTQTAFGLKMEEVPQLIDEMAKAASTGNTSVSQLGDAFLTIGGLAQELNGGFITLADGTQKPISGIQEMEVALVAMANAGVKGSEAGTHMRNMILKLTSPTKEGAEALENMGIAVFDDVGNMRSLSGILGDLSKKLGTMTQQEKLQAISNLFNTRDLASAEALLKAVGQDWDAIGAEILDAQGAAQQMADTQLDNLSGDVTKLGSAWSELQLQLSDKLTPALRDVVQFVTQLIQNFDTVGPIIAGVATAFGVLAVALNIGKIVTGVTTSVTALFNVLAANPIAIVIAAIVGLVTWLVTAYNTNEEFREKVDAVWNALKTSVIDTWNSIKNAFTTAGAELKADWEKLKSGWENIVQSISQKVQELGSRFKSGYDAIRSATQNVLSSIKSAMENIRSTITNVASSAVSWGRDLMNNFIGGIKAKFADLRNAVANAAQTVKNFLGFSEPDQGPLSNFHTYAPDMMKLFAKGIEDNEHMIKDAFNESLDLSAPVIKTSSDGSSGSALGGHARELVVNITELIDGSVLARNQYKYNLDEADRHGGNLINAYA